MTNRLQEERQLRDLNRHLNASGVDGNFDFKLNTKVQWYKADGTPLPKLLPVDDYHLQLYMGKGWTLTPPRDPVSIPAGPSLIEQELQRNKELAEAKAKGQGLSPVEQEIQREIAGKLQDAVPVVDENVPDFITPEPVEAEPAVGLECTEQDCPYVAEGETERLRKVRLEKHIYGPFSKHKKEKQA